MSISGSLSNALSGLTAAGRAAAVVSSNISNSMTEGYAKRDLILTERMLAGAGAGVRVVGVAVEGRRAETNLPTQSLFLLNSPFVVQQSQRFASTLLAKNATTSQRIDWLFKSILRRPPTRDERSSAMRYLEHSRQMFDSSGKESSGRTLTIWASLVQGLVSTNEFRYID